MGWMCGDPEFLPLSKRRSRQVRRNRRCYEQVRRSERFLFEDATATRGGTSVAASFLTPTPISIAVFLGKTTSRPLMGLPSPVQEMGTAACGIRHLCAHHDSIRPNDAFAEQCVVWARPRRLHGKRHHTGSLSKIPDEAWRPPDAILFRAESGA